MEQSDFEARRDEVSRGIAVSGLINEPIIKETVDGILHSCQNQWLYELDPIKREILWQQTQGVVLFIQTLKGVVDTGKMAAAQLETEKAMRKNDQES